MARRRPWHHGLSVIIVMIAYLQLTLSLMRTTPNRQLQDQSPSSPLECRGIIETPDQENSTDLTLSCEYPDGTTIPIINANQSWIHDQLSHGTFHPPPIILLPAQTQTLSDRIILPPSIPLTLLPSLGPTTRSFELSSPNRPRTHGTRTILAVRVIALDSETTASLFQLSDNIFGTGLTETDRHNVKSQYHACSYGQLTFEPAPPRPSVISGPLRPNVVGINHGVTEVRIYESVIGKNRNEVVTAVTKALRKQFGVNSPERLADHVMYCLPPGTGDWIAYATIDRWRSVFNDKWCNSVSTQTHEIGHNIGLCHSGQKGDPYADQSGMMGFSYIGDDSHIMCFDPAKSWQLGWYDDRTRELSPHPHTRSTHTFVGVSDYKSRVDAIVVLKINTRTEQDFYVSFNRQAGINGGTKEGANRLLIVSAGGEGRECSQSWLLKKLKQDGDDYVISNFDDSGLDLNISLETIKSTSEPWTATVVICLGDCDQPQQQQQSVVKQKETMVIIPTTCLSSSDCQRLFNDNNKCMMTQCRQKKRRRHLLSNVTNTTLIGEEDRLPFPGTCVRETLNCDDGKFCNGVETCSPLKGCVPGDPPCNAKTELCVEYVSQCVKKPTTTPDNKNNNNANDKTIIDENERKNHHRPKIWTTIFFDDFETGRQHFSHDGRDAYWVNNTSKRWMTHGSGSMLIRDDSGADSSIRSETINVSSFIKIEVAFSYFGYGMRKKDSFHLEVRTDAEKEWRSVDYWMRDVHFENKEWYDISVYVGGLEGVERMQIRFRCQGRGGNSARVFIDDVRVSGTSVVV